MPLQSVKYPLIFVKQSPLFFFSNDIYRENKICLKMNEKKMKGRSRTSIKLTRRFLTDCTSSVWEKDGDWYNCPEFVAHEKLVIKTYSKVLKPSNHCMHNVISMRTNTAKIWLSLCLMSCVKFAWYTFSPSRPSM